MVKTIAVTLRKGGSGKTTTAINLATALLKRGKRVLLVDLDPQSNATISVGIDPTNLKKNDFSSAFPFSPSNPSWPRRSPRQGSLR